jgi:MFS family permease
MFEEDILMSQDGMLKPKSWTDGMTRYHLLVLVVACLGWSFDTMDQWLFVFAKQHALRELLTAQGMLTGLEKAAADGLVGYYSNVATAALMIGWAVGGLFFGMVGDRLGRTKTMALTILTYAIFTGLSGLSQTWEQFALFRFLTGLGVGGEFAAGAALVAETFPSHSRATALGIVQASSSIGNVTAGLLNMGFASMALSWRWLFAVGIVPALLVVVIFAFVKEPAAWTESRQRVKAGREKSGTIFGLFSEPWLRRNTLVGLCLAAVGVIGFWGISVWTPELLRGVLNPNGDVALKAATESRISLAGITQNLGGFCGALCFAWVAQRIGRRGAFVIALTACVTVIPATFYFTTSFATALVFFFLMGAALLYFLSGFAVYFPELFPTRLRSTGTGFCYNVARFVTAGALFASAPFVRAYGLSTTVMCVSAVFLLGFIVLIFAPETKDKPLPE